MMWLWPLDAARQALDDVCEGLAWANWCIDVYGAFGVRSVVSVDPPVGEQPK